MTPLTDREIRANRRAHSASEWVRPVEYYAPDDDDLRMTPREWLGVILAVPAIYGLLLMLCIAFGR